MTGARKFAEEYRFPNPFPNPSFRVTGNKRSDIRLERDRARTCYGDLVSWALFFREQALCRCGHTRGEHRWGPVSRLVRALLGCPNACAVCPCREFAPAGGPAGSARLLTIGPSRPNSGATSSRFLCGQQPPAAPHQGELFWLHSHLAQPCAVDCFEPPIHEPQDQSLEVRLESFARF